MAVLGIFHDGHFPGNHIITGVQLKIVQKCATLPQIYHLRVFVTSQNSTGIAPLIGYFLPVNPENVSPVPKICSFHNLSEFHWTCTINLIFFAGENPESVSLGIT